MSKNLEIEMVNIPGGQFTMGNGMPGCPNCQMTVSPFQMSKFVITQYLWKKVMKTEPWSKKNVKKGDDLPAVFVSYLNACKFCQKISKLEGMEFLLPSEVQWEYAYRCGTTSRYIWGDYSDGFAEYAWVRQSQYPEGKPCLQPVGKLKPNPFGLYDMGGLIQQWIRDLTTPDGVDPAKDHYPSSATDFVSTEGSCGMVRGSSCFDDRASASACSKLLRPLDFKDYDIGFRVVIEGQR